MLLADFDDYEAECLRCLEAGLPLPAYDHVLKCSHAFNLLDARGAHQRHRAGRLHLPRARAGRQVAAAYLAQQTEGADA